MRWVLPFAFAQVLLASAAAQQAPDRGAITGVVFDATNGQPLAGAIVTLARLDTKEPIPRVVTDPKGRFVFRDLPPSDQYFLGARRFGYEYTRYGWTAPGQTLATADIARITIAKDQWVDGIRIPLWRYGSIAGRVVDERGEPVVGVAVRVFSQTTIAGQKQLVAGALATTDDRGVYRFDGLAPAKYFLAVLSVQSTVLTTTPEAPIQRPVGELATGGIGGGRGASVSMPAVNVDDLHRLVVTNFVTPPPPGAGGARAYPATFYPGVLLWTDASPIDIAYGTNRTGADVQLRPVPAWRVSGRLEAPGGGTVPQLLLRLMPSGHERLGFGAEAATTVVDRDGTFTFLNVPQGNYTLLAQASVMDFTSDDTSTRLPDAPGFPAGGISVGSLNGAPGLGYLARNGATVPFWGRTTVGVGGRDVDDVLVTLHPIVTVHGRFAFAEGTPVPPATTRLVVTAEPANGDPTLGRPIGFGEAGGAPLTFTIQGLLGGTYLLTNAFLPYRIVSVMFEGRDVTYTGLDAARGQDLTDVVVTLTDKKISIGGVVTGPQGASVAGVLAFPVDRARWVNFGWEPSFFSTTRSGSNGAYRLQYLSEGEYYLIAVDAAQIDAWVDPAFLAAAAPKAVRVSVRWGDNKLQDLTISEVAVK